MCFFFSFFSCCENLCVKKNFLEFLKITDNHNNPAASDMKVKFQGSKSISSHSKQSNNSTSPSPQPPSPPGDKNNTNNHKSTPEPAADASSPSALEEFSIDWIYPRLKRPSAFWHFASVMTIAVVGIFSKLILGMFSLFYSLFFRVFLYSVFGFILFFFFLLFFLPFVLGLVLVSVR